MDITGLVMVAGVALFAAMRQWCKPFRRFCLWFESLDEDDED